MGQDRLCDNNSVGIIARDGQGRILMVERRKKPFGFAPPAGHLDGLGYYDACLKEFREETGLRIMGVPRSMTLMQRKIYNECHRGGKFHYWQVFEVDWQGEIKQNIEETKWIGWKTPEEVCSLARKTYGYLEARGLVNFIKDRNLVEKLNKVIDDEWQSSPGLEVAWLSIFEELRVI